MPERKGRRTNLEELRGLLDLFREYGLTEIEIERGGERVRLRREVPPAAPPGAAAPAVSAPMPAPASQTAPATGEPYDDRRRHLVTVEAPMVGTFYRASSPDADPYVREGLVRAWRIRPWTVVIGADVAS